MVVADSHSPRDGAFLKIIGHYNPLAEPAALVVKEEEAVYWLQKGAQPSETAAKLLTRIGVMERAGRQPVVYTPKEGGVKPKKQAEAAAPVAPAAAAAPPETPAEVAAEAPAAEAPAEAPTEAPEAQTAAEVVAEAPAAEAPAEVPTEAPEATAEPEAAEPAAEAEAEPPAEGETQDDSETTE